MKGGVQVKRKLRKMVRQQQIQVQCAALQTVSIVSKSQ